jgi:hypothetical protein
VASDAQTPSAEEFIARRRAADAKGRRVKAKDVLRTGTHSYRVEQATYRVQSNNPQKVLLIERLRWEGFVPNTPDDLPRRDREPDEISYRIGYCVVSRSGRWWWGQFAAMIPKDDLDALIALAREEGTLLPPGNSRSPSEALP